MDNFVELEFESIKFMAVKDYDEYLTMLYKNYMKLPPKDKQRRHIPIAEFAPPPDFNKNK